MDYEIISEGIGIRTEIPFLYVTEAEICHEMNVHGITKIRAVVSEENQETVCNRNWKDTKVIIFERQETDIPIFYGHVEKMNCQIAGQFLEIDIYAIGETVFLDYKKKKRSFQNTAMSYKQMIEEILREYEDTDYIWNIGEDKKIEVPVVQYEETDWELLIRLCSHFNKCLIPELRAGKPCFHFGMNTAKQHELNEENASILGRGFDDSYFQNGCYEGGMHIKQALYLIVRTKENWQMGDCIEHARQHYRVYKRIITFKNSEIIFTYYLGTEGVYYQKRKYNAALSGVRLEGTVRKVEEESVYLQLDMDEKEGADYPWAWTPETNNLCYCMPEADAKATLYFPSREEKEGVVVLAVIKNENNAQYVDSQNREFATAYQKKMGLYPDKLFLEGMNRMVSLSMEDNRGIQISSNTSIAIMADNKICINGESLFVTAPLEIVCKTPLSNIELCKDINMYAPGGVKTVGIEDTSAIQNSDETVNSQEKQEVECWQASYSALAAIPSADVGKMNDAESVLELYACGSIPKIAKGSTTIALSEVMEGSKAEESSFPNAFHSMENYTVKGGYALPLEE